LATMSLLLRRTFPSVTISMAKPLRVGVVGCGRAAYWHISSMRKIGNIEVAAVCDNNEALARRAAKNLHIKSAYADLSEMLSEERVEVVDICTPPPTHSALATQAMAAGCHVLTEKPMALSLEEADEMIGVARANQVQLCVVHNELFIPVVLKARAMVDEGVVGDVVGVSITDSMPRDGDLVLNKEHWCHRLPGGIFGEMLPHPIYLVQAFLGELEPAAVHSQKLGSHDWMAVDELRVILEGKNGLATITESVNWAEDFMLLDIFGTKMSLRVDLWGMVITRYAVAVGEGRLSRGWQNLGLGFGRLAGTAAAFNVVSGRFGGGYRSLIARFFESVRSGIGTPVTVEEAREAVGLYQAVVAQI
jgi:predicted dehydrogenase